MTKQREDARKLEALRRRIKAGDDAFERGDFVELGEAELERYFERIAAGRHNLGFEVTAIGSGP